MFEQSVGHLIGKGIWQIELLYTKWRGHVKNEVEGQICAVLVLNHETFQLKEG